MKIHTKDDLWRKGDELWFTEWFVDESAADEFAKLVGVKAKRFNGAHVLWCVRYKRRSRIEPRRRQ